jgi:hypothetical protein
MTRSSRFAALTVAAAIAGAGAGAARAVSTIDATGATKIDSTHIRESDGSVTTCGAGTHVVAQSTSKGTVYLCEP